ncbi:MAG: hypothetical protein WCR30_02700 [Clostridia bacterium]
MKKRTFTLKKFFCGEFDQEHNRYDINEGAALLSLVNFIAGLIVFFTFFIIPVLPLFFLIASGVLMLFGSFEALMTLTKFKSPISKIILRSISGIGSSFKNIFKKRTHVNTLTGIKEQVPPYISEANLAQQEFNERTCTKPSNGFFDNYILEICSKKEHIPTDEEVSKIFGSKFSKDLEENEILEPKKIKPNKKSKNKTDDREM